MDERLILRVRQMTSFGMGLAEVTKKLVGDCTPEMVFLAFHAARLLDCSNTEPNSTPLTIR